LNRYLLPLFLVSLLFLLSSCGSKAPPPTPEWNYQRDAIHMRVKSDYQLNLNEGSPHTLMMCVYQLDNLAPFNKLSWNEEGIYSLLNCELFDNSVKEAKRLIIHPGQDMSFIMDRAQGTRYVGVITGYFLLQRTRIIRSYNIPVSRDDNRATAEELDINLNLGAQQIEGQLR